MLTIKELCYVFKISRWTVRRRKQEGCPIHGGRIPASVYAWWMEERDAARRAGLAVRAWLALGAKERQSILDRIDGMDRMSTG